MEMELSIPIKGRAQLLCCRRLVAVVQLSDFPLSYGQDDATPPGYIRALSAGRDSL